MSKGNKKANIKFFLVGIWFVFTFSLAGWWLVFGLNQIEFLQGLPGLPEGSKVINQHKMILWEGGILLLSLLVGGGALIYLVTKERAQSKKLKNFFATFSHELRTSLTSLRLQAESLQDELGEEESKSSFLERLLEDTVRLQIQLENSLFLANIDKSKLFIEKIQISKIIESFSEHWPEANIELSVDSYVMADHRALESVLKNAIQNSIYHGKASKVLISSIQSEVNEDSITLKISDNGEGFFGDKTKLGLLFERQTTRSGSGIGTYLISKLCKKMNGKAIFKGEGKDFHLLIGLNGELI